MDSSFDLIVIGAGSGGLAAAKRAAKHGARVALVEGDRVGGTCVIRGCVPKKLLGYGAMYREYLQNASSYGVRINNFEMDSKELLANVRNEVDRLNRIHINLLEKIGVELFTGWAQFNDKNSISILSSSNSKNNSLKNIKADKILISAGGVPLRPNIPGSRLGWVSDDMFLLNRFPKSIVVVGSGFVACEFASILNDFGVNVTQIVRGKILLKGFDIELSNALEEEMSAKGVKLVFEEEPKSLSGEIGNINLKAISSKTYSCEGVLFAIGRRPRVEDLNLGLAGVIYKDDKILVNEIHQTNIDNIFAIGDITNRINLTPVAIEEGRVFADRNFANLNRTVDYDFIPKAVFTNPPMANVGLSEESAKAIFGMDSVRTYQSKFRPMSKALPKIGSKCFLKLVVHSKTEKVLGCHMLGEDSPEIIQMATIPLQMGAKKKDFDRAMALHPTIAEEFVTMI